MRWFNGGIAEAIAFSKSKGAIFVVYIEGKDETSQQITKLIETAEVTSKLDNDNFVAIKIEAGSVPHQQFVVFYNQTPVPSIYFIGKNGSPIKIIEQAIDVSSLSKELDQVLNMAGISPSAGPSQAAASASANFIASEQAPPISENVVCDNGVCVIKRNPEPAPAEQSTPAPAGDQLTAAEKLERAKKLLDAKREEKERQEKELEKQKEIERRKMGQEVQKMKQRQEDQELKQLRQDREKEKRQEREARERVLAQIAQDKAERAAKFSPPHYSSPIANVPLTGSIQCEKPDYNNALLQFKLPDGSTKTQDFPSTDKLISVVNFVGANLNVPAKFTLSTTFPRKQFTVDEYNQTLAELKLTPNAVLLVLPSSSVSTNQRAAGGVMGFVFTLLTPLFGIMNFIKAFLGFGGDSGNVNQDYGAEPSGTRRYNSVQSCTQFNFENQLKTAGSKLVVVDFFATWCGPCKQIAPELERMAREFPNVVFLKVDVDQNSDLTRQHNVTAMPTFLFFKNRRELTRVQGADSYEIRTTIQRYK